MTTYLFVTLQLLAASLTQRPTRDERGSLNTEQALWVGAVVLLATVVIATINGFVDGNLAILK